MLGVICVLEVMMSQRRHGEKFLKKPRKYDCWKIKSWDLDNWGEINPTTKHIIIYYFTKQ